MDYQNNRQNRSRSVQPKMDATIMRARSSAFLDDCASIKKGMSRAIKGPGPDRKQRKR